ncbi:hypothetical protein O6H91_06G022000 [Diphasiastrum complanatum]|uniref:Uncharacterized protein n=1 Tax=Diphasiastrum complanatum TaxID=34168 RepID=A0ACC2DC10_DIPCM|nr:hypothetical protein O6H91_Y213000 [Diphasiastrum complanatum]KAJ7295097.1 hypothetical protein O6H91_Y213000 [Diphasiastrum complanatum]KAJ7551632.1 hypothetical protein O6H91_06G022000 [Diphasiastrum complanatum]
MEVSSPGNTDWCAPSSLQALQIIGRLGPLASNDDSVSVIEACADIRKEGSTLCGHPLESRDLLETFIEVGLLSERVKSLESAFTVVGDPLQCTNEVPWRTEFQTNQGVILHRSGEQSCTIPEADEEDCGDIPEHHERFLLGCIGDDIVTDQSISEFEIEEKKSSAWLEGSSCNSTHAVDSQTLDDFVQQIKVEKQQLTDVIEEIRSLHQKADISEALARKSKSEAARGGKVIIAKVDEMKHMLAHAREANAAHAGEVYGEKAVLSTEARELLARLVQIREEKAKAVGILNDIHETLHARIKSANQEREAAEEELLLKETAAKNALAVEEDLMAKVAQESRNLEIEDEVCKKFREFLIDRGSMVDSLQAEMAILCEDVEALKKAMCSVDLVNASQLDMDSSSCTAGNWEFEDTQVSFRPLNLLDGHNLRDPSEAAQEKLKESISVYDNGKSDGSHSSHTALDLSYSAGSLAIPAEAEASEYGQIDFPQQKNGITSESSIPSYDSMRQQMEIGDSCRRWSNREKESDYLDLSEPENDRVRSFRESSPEEDGWNLVFTS